MNGKVKRGNNQWPIYTLKNTTATMNVLFVSHTRGKWAEDCQKTYEYLSDFHILAVNKDRHGAGRVINVSCNLHGHLSYGKTKILTNRQMNNKLKTVTLNTLLDKHIGKPGTERREAFENELKTDLLGHAIKQERKKRNLK
jgi:hypothetical protein